MAGFRMRRLGWMMEPEPGNPMEAEGVLNPAAVRGPMASSTSSRGSWREGNYSRIGMARVRVQ